MTPFEDDLARSLRLLEPGHAATDEQWRENVARLGRRRRPRMSAGVLAACAAAVVSLLIAGTLLIVHHLGSRQPVGPPDGTGSYPSPSCSTLSGAGATTVPAALSSTASITLQFIPDSFGSDSVDSDSFRSPLCVGNASHVDQVDLSPARDYATALRSLGPGSTWLLALGPQKGDSATKLTITTSNGQVRTVERRSALVDVGGRWVYAVELGSTAQWVRTEFLDAQGRRIELLKTPLAAAPTRSQAQSADSSMSAAAEAMSSEPSTSVPPPGPDMSCLPTSTAPAPEFWLVLSCAGSPQNSTLWFGHGGTPTDNGASVTIYPDFSKTFPYLNQMGIGSDVLVGAFPADTTTAVLSLTDGRTVTVGVSGHAWINLRSGWKGMIYFGNSADRVERVSTFSATHALLGTQELFY